MQKEQFSPLSEKHRHTASAEAAFPALLRHSLQACWGHYSTLLWQLLVLDPTHQGLNQWIPVLTLTAALQRNFRLQTSLLPLSSKLWVDEEGFPIFHRHQKWSTTKFCQIYMKPRLVLQRAVEKPTDFVATALCYICMILCRILKHNVLVVGLRQLQPTSFLDYCTVAIPSHISVVRC